MATIALAGCTPPIPLPARVDHLSPPPPAVAALQPQDTIGVVDAAGTGSDTEFVACVRQGLQARLRDRRILDVAGVRFLAWPGIGPIPLEGEPPSDFWTRTISEDTHRRLTAGGLRLVIAVQGNTMQGRRDGMYEGAPRTTRITARMIDLRERTVSGPVEVRTSGTRGEAYALIVVNWISVTEETACDRISGVLASSINKTPDR